MKKRIAITDSFLNSVFRLNNQDRKLAFNTAKQIAENSTAPSLHLHSIDREKCDKKFLSARINLDLRMILVNRGDVCTLLYVDHHDDAYDWCEGKYLLKTDFGAEYIYDEKNAAEKIEGFKKENDIPEYLQFKNEKSMLELHEVKKKNLLKLGIQEIHADNLMKIADEEQLLSYIEFFPEELQEAIIDLATGIRSFDEVYNRLCMQNADENGCDSIRRFYLTEDMCELELLMQNEDFEKWTIFLHPSQDKLVKMNCNGPMLVEGGPGTGKSIVGIHRAVRLAADYYTKDNGKRILFCTYSKKLANCIHQKILRLCEIKGVANNIDVMSVDAYIARLLGDRALPIGIKEIEGIIKKVYRTNNWEYSYEFYLQEYYEVIEKNNITNKEKYLEISRAGSGQGLNKNSREKIWQFFELVEREKHINQTFSFVDRAYQLNDLIDQGKIEKKYDSIIIDEAQDLENIKLRALCKSVKNEKNGACILSDRNQRIFRLNAWSSDAGINIIGRTFYLRLNYRTTKQINDYARSQFFEFDLGNPASREYISLMSGDNPEIVSCKTDSEENRIIVERTKKILNDYNADEICILAPTYEKLNAINAIFEYEDINADLLTGDEIPISNGNIKICTTSGVKGLEFSVVVIASFNKIGTQRQNYGCAAEMAINYEKLVECEKYVAITRARDRVLITYTED
jgi:hypothetical protein